MFPKVLGIDPGYGFFKGAGPEAPYGTGFRSIIGALPGERPRNYFTQPDQLDIYVPKHQRWYVFGDYAERMLGTERVQHMSGTERVTSHNFVNFFYAAFSRLLRPGEHTVWLVTGLPVVDMNRRGYVDAVHTLLQGTHEFSSHEGDYRIHVENTFVIEQPMGSFFNYILDANATGVDPQRERLMTETSVFIDVGTLTTDVMTLRKNFLIPPDGCGSTEAGVRVLYKLIRDRVFGGWSESFPLSELDDVIRRRQWEDPTTQEVVDVSDVMLQAREYMWSQVEELLRDLTGDARNVDNFFVVGGGAGLVRNYIQQKFGEHRVIAPFERPENSNVVGFQRYGTWQAYMAQKED